MGERHSRDVSLFHDPPPPEPAQPVGYAALIARHGLCLPRPPRLAAIAERHRPESTDAWLLLTPRHRPADTLGGHLEFAVKWEGVRLSVLSRLFQAIPGEEVARVVRNKPTGMYTRRIWFLYEWLTGRRLDLPDTGKVRSVPALDPGQQFAIADGPLSARHSVVDNLPGTREFCPLVRRTETLEHFVRQGLGRRAREAIGRVHPDLLARAAAFLLLEDSRASFRIEGVAPPPARAARWGRAIGEAGSRPLEVDELERLQRILIGDSRFVHLGLRVEGGFVGPRDRLTGDPIPEHISARAADLDSLLRGVVAYAERSLAGGLDAVVTAAAVAFGFVYVHPFEDGNGRIHRWLMHHVLARAGYAPADLVFPISAAILREIRAYRRVLGSYSQPLLSCIEWRPTDSGNVEVLNETADYYRYFDATAHAEFLYRCVEGTVEHDLPAEVTYLRAYERFAEGVQRIVADMPDRTIDLLHRFLRQGAGHLSKRARGREFEALTDAEVEQIEELYRDCFAEPPEGPPGASTEGASD